MPELVVVLKAMGSETRMEVLRQLREPRPLAEIRVLAHDGSSDRPPRPLARQTVHKHLTRLQEAGLVREYDGQGRKHYVADRPRLREAVQMLQQVAVGPGVPVPA